MLYLILLLRRAVIVNILSKTRNNYNISHSVTSFNIKVIITKNLNSKGVWLKSTEVMRFKFGD